MSGNGTDQGHIVAMLQQVLVSMDGLGRRFDGLDRKVDALERKVDGLAADVAGLRQTVTHYHGSVLGHAFLITDLEHRVRRIETHLDLPPPIPHS